MERYNFKTVEEKWQDKWNKSGAFKSKVDHSKKILLSRNVSIPFRQNTYGSR